MIFKVLIKSKWEIYYLNILKWDKKIKGKYGIIFKYHKIHFIPQGWPIKVTHIELPGAVGSKAMEKIGQFWQLKMLEKSFKFHNKNKWDGFITKKTIAVLT